MKPLMLTLRRFAALAEAPGKQTFTGTITDSMCVKADHSQMRMGPTDAECPDVIKRNPRWRPPFGMLVSIAKTAQ
jgi:hypothetical protein